MGEVSGKLADLTVITSDNPRFEEPQAIIDDIKTGIGRTRWTICRNLRSERSNTLCHRAWTEGDVIVLAGKGHEEYQEIKGVKYPMDERVLIREVLEELKAEKK